MKISTIVSPFGDLLPRRLGLYALPAALACGLLLSPGGAPLYGGVTTEGAAVAGTEQPLEDFEAEVRQLASAVDAISKRYAAGDAVETSFKELIEHWEGVEIHEAIEAKAIYLYPPIWQGIFSMKKAAEKEASPAEMTRACERTKGALWQALGGLRALAEQPAATPLHVGRHATEIHDHEGHGLGVLAHTEPTNNRIELTGDDNMRYNKTHFVVRTGEPVTLRFKNIGELPKEVMGHNVVILDRGTAVEPFGIAAASASENDYIPTDPAHAKSVLAHTELLGGGEADSITFTLEDAGEYPFLCSFTAHFRLMQGTIEAVAAADAEPVGLILRQLRSALEIYEKGDAKEAETRVLAAYINVFEGLEGDLIEIDPELVSQLELDFNAGLPSLFQEGAPVSEVRAYYEKMEARLQKAKRFLDQAEVERSSVF